VKSNHATAKKIVERLPVDDDSETADETDSTAGHDDESTTDNDSEINNSGSDQSTALGSRDNFWGG